MNSPIDIYNELKKILEGSGAPSQLDDHPWTKSLLVQTSADKEAEAASPGYRLLAVISDLYRQSRPAKPPRRGGRLDTRWGEFSLLGALYFAPLDFGNARPSTLQDAWGRLDEVIWAYQFGESHPQVSESERARYALVSHEAAAAPVSTLSDWRLRGLERLAEQIAEREKLLSARHNLPSVLLDPQAEPVELRLNEPPSSLLWGWYQQHRRNFWLGVGLALFILTFWQGFGLFFGYRAFKADVDRLQTLISSEPSLVVLEESGELLTQTRRDAQILQRRLRPWGWAGRLLGWLPVYGGDLASAEALVEMAVSLAISADESYQAAAPLLTGLILDGENPSIPDVLTTLSAGRERLAAGMEAADRALAARELIDLSRLSPKTRPLVEQLDFYLPLLGDGLRVLYALPELLGDPDFGPQSYLVLIQNEDEIRATGGFITAMAVVTVEQGEIIAMQVDDSYAADDLTKYYPSPPWQIGDYLVGGVWLFRDANWSPDFPTTAAWAEYLYAIGRLHSVDGVIAIDQETLRLLLAAVGPLTMPDASEPISAENFIEYMRASRGKSEGEDDWFTTRKDFMGPLGFVILEKLQNDPSVPMRAVAEALLQALNERHILLQFDNDMMREVLASRGWDGAVTRPDRGDFLLVVDSNLGFNKVNAAAQTSLTYNVDLSNPRSPRAELVTLHRNNAQEGEPCRHAAYDPGNYAGLINRCYWNYLRVYTLAETGLDDATPHEVPAEWMLSGEAVPPRVDVLDNEGLLHENPPGLQAYGTLLVVPIGEELQTRFEIALPAGVLQFEEDGEIVRYTLHVQRQSGTLANELSLAVQLPPGAELIASEPVGIYQNGVWLVDTDLRQDVFVDLLYRQP